MATQVSISSSDRWAKIRNPVGVYFLCWIPFYSWFWWYYINRELRDLGVTRGVPGLGDNPGLSTVAFVLGPYAILIPFVWTIVGTTKRIQLAQRVVGVHDEMSGWIAGLLWVFTFGIGGIIYTQSSLNKVWRTQPAAYPSIGAGPAPTTDADLERLRTLADLKNSGSISEQQFEAERARILPGTAVTQQPVQPATSEGFAQAAISQTNPSAEEPAQQSAGSQDLPPAGWYSDPTQSGRLRWWDGAQWTEHYAPTTPI